MFNAAITLDAGDRKALVEFLEATPRELEKAQVRALNRAATQARNEIQRLLKVNLSAKDKKRSLRNKTRATRRRLEATIDASGRLLNLTRYGGFTETRDRVRVTAAGSMRFLRRAAAGGIRVKPYRGQPAVRYPHGFVARRGTSIKGPAAHRALRGASRSYTMPYEANQELQSGVESGELVGRLPLIYLAGPSVADEFSERIGDFERRAVNLYARKLSAELDYELSKRR